MPSHQRKQYQLEIKYTAQKKKSTFCQWSIFLINQEWCAEKSPLSQETLYISFIVLDQVLRHIRTDKQGFRNFQEIEWEYDVYTLGMNENTQMNVCNSLLAGQYNIISLPKYQFLRAMPHQRRKRKSSWYAAKWFESRGCRKTRECVTHSNSAPETLSPKDWNYKGPSK